MFNAAQPIRPDYTDDGIPLLYRTQPKKQSRLPKFYSIQQILASTRLYRAARRGDIPGQVAISDLYEFTMEGIYDVTSKNAMGHSVVNSLLYEPRKLLNRKDIKATMTYRILNPLDLIYGLEWQICAVLYTWMDKNGEFPKDREQWQPKMDETLDELANSDHIDYLGLFEEPLLEDAGELMMMEPDWIKIIQSYPERQIRNKPRAIPKDLTRPKPRDMSECPQFRLPEPRPKMESRERGRSM